jgi:hypothetical protein
MVDGRELKPTTANSNPDGPDPYARGPGDGPRCPNCDSFTGRGGSSFCDQCGQGLADGADPSGPGTPGHSADAYAEHPDDTVQCSNDAAMNAPDAIFCRRCGASIPSSAYAATATGATAASMSSSGRRPGTSPQARRLWLDSFAMRSQPTPGGPALAQRLEAADGLVAVLEEAWEAADEAASRARFLPAPEPPPPGLTTRDRAAHVAGQLQMEHARRQAIAAASLPPSLRSAWLAEANAVAERDEIAAALESARAARTRLASQWDAVSAEFSLQGERPATTIPDLGPDATLADHERAAERARARRLR